MEGGSMSATASIDEAPALTRRAITGDTPEVLTDIYQNATNMVIWQRQLSNELVVAIGDLLYAKPTLQTSLVVTPKSVFSSIHNALGETATSAVLAEDIAQLVDMFCCLFDLKRAGLRLTVLDRAMCPRFHVDKVPSRLVTTYQGIATEWLPHDRVDRSKLGFGSEGKPDEKSGIFQHPEDVHRLYKGEVALLKGESWEGNEGAGLVHRSPSMSANNESAQVNTICESRLLLTLDFN
jgi:hypothetical protein